MDRAATLRSAEKLLCQGKLEPALAEYLRVLDDRPRDWNTANIVGDLYVRAGKVDAAISHFVTSGDVLNDEGALSRAAALYKKILKLRPEHEHALLQCAEIAATQGVLVDARTFLKAVAERRRARGDQRGVAQITIRLASLDSDDLPARLAGAHARIAVKDVPGAVRDLREIAVALHDRGRTTEAIGALREAIGYAPGDPDARRDLIKALVAAGFHRDAREHARTPEELQLIPASGDVSSAIETSETPDGVGISSSPDGAAADSDVPTQGGSAVEQQNEQPLEAALDPTKIPTLESVGQLVRDGRLDGALGLVRRLLAQDAGCRDKVTLFGLSLCHEADLAFAVIDLATDAFITDGDWASAAAGLQELVTRVPLYLPALMRLIDVCVDGSLEATMHAAQAQLTDAYLEAGAAKEARFLAEELVAREPWDRAHIERFRRALEMLGEPDPNAVIAARLGGDSPFTSTDESIASAIFATRVTSAGPVPASWPDGDQPEATPPSTRPVQLWESLEPSGDLPSAHPVQDPVQTSVAPTPWIIDNHNFEFSPALEGAHAVVLAAAHNDVAGTEMDLSAAVDDLQPSSALEQQAVDAETGTPTELAGLLGQFRDEAARRSALAAAEEEYARGVAAHAAGRFDECVALLTTASRSPQLRFATASLLGRIHRQFGRTDPAIEWFEQAAQAPPPSREEGHLLLYDLADVLESSGEDTRALAVWMELQADAGSYRDVSSRIERLAAMQTRG
jgi:tetratricopeptide (TPR) repeat protein